MIWFTSDFHFCHNQNFIYEPRGFNDINSMNETIISNFNEVVSPEDDIYILGDCILNDNEEGMKLMRQLHGHLHILRGNHDTDMRVMMYVLEPNITYHGYAVIVKENGYHFYLSHYPTLTDNFDSDKPLKGRMINLCGHTHTKDKFKDIDKGLCYHVELDAHNNYPVSIDEIIKDIKEKINER